CLHAKLKSGAKLIAQMIELEQELEDATFVITGEGKTDEQTLYGKAPSYVATLAKQYNVPTVLFSGSIKSNNEKLQDQFAGCFTIVNGTLSLEESMSQAETLLYEQTKQIMSLILTFYKRKGVNVGGRNWFNYLNYFICSIYYFCYSKVKITSILIVMACCIRFSNISRYSPN